MSNTPQSELAEEPVPLETAAAPPLEKRRGRRARKPFHTSEEELASVFFTVLIILIAFESLFRALAKGFWFDEVLTSLVAGQAHISGMWNLLKNGVDGHPPGIYIVEHMMAKLGGNERLTYRLAPLAAFLFVMIALYSFLRRRTGALIAVASVAALLLTDNYDPFAFEARSYGLMVAFIVAAILCYERIDSKWWSALFALCLAAACSMHFYAILAFFPFGLAELATTVTNRRIRFQVWLGFVVGALPLAFFWPILQAQRVMYGAHFWADTNFWSFAVSLGQLMHWPTSVSFALFLATFFYLVYLVASGKAAVRPATARGTGFSTTDMILTLGFLGLPFVTYVVTKIGHAGLSGRYFTTTALGITLALALILTRMQRPTVLAIGFFIVCVFAFQEAAQWRAVFKPREVKDAFQLPTKMAKDLNIPLVISNGLVYLPVWHQAGEDLRSHYYFLADPQQQLAASDSDTTTLILMTLKKYFPVNVESFPDFSREHRKFLIFSNGDAQDYWPRWMLQHGYSLHTVIVDPPTHAVIADIPDPPKAIVYYVDLDEPKLALAGESASEK